MIDTGHRTADLHANNADRKAQRSGVSMARSHIATYAGRVTFCKNYLEAGTCVVSHLGNFCYAYALQCSLVLRSGAPSGLCFPGVVHARN